jgi:competence protein ComEC
MKQISKLLLMMLLCIGLTISSKSIVFASNQDLNTLYKSTYDAVMKVDKTATENGVKPYYSRGASTTENVANATSKGMQIYIYEARTLIDQLPDELIDIKRTFSSMLDEYQHPIYERIVYVINTNKDNPKQNDINLGRTLIKDLPDVFKSPYSVALDQAQGKLFAKADNLVAKAVATKDNSDSLNARQVIAELKTIPIQFASSDIKSFVNAIETKLNTVVPSTDSEQLKIHFIDVGQADSILVQQGNHYMLVDAGNNEDSQALKNYLDQQKVTELQYFVGTHKDEDHIGSADYVINSFKVGKVYFPKQTATTKTFEDFVIAVKNKGLQLTAPTVGDSFKLGEATVTILAPNNSSYTDANDYSIVLKVQYGNTSFLLTGDAETVSESEMLLKGLDVSATVLKVGHHGSLSSTSQNFLDKVNPKYAVISVGKGNTYGHPTQEVMDRLKAKSVKVYRTDESGTIVATSNGTDVSFNVTPGSYSGIKSSSSTSTSSGNSVPSTNNTTTAPKPAPAPIQTAPSSGGQQYVDANGNGLIKGNISSTKEKIYHMPGGAYYNRTDAEVYFKTEAEAQAAGFRKSLR